jgi:hypothetical protein
MKKTFLTLLLISISIFASDTSVKTGEFPAKEMKAQKTKMAKMMAEELNSSLPQVVDRYTTLASIKSDKATLIYTFKINTGAKSDETVRKESRSRMKKAVTNGVCQSAKKLLLAGISYSYIYISAKSNAHLFQFDISQKDCIPKIK